MDKIEQAVFVKSIVKEFQKKLLADIAAGKIPAAWDGLELRWLLSKRFDTNWAMSEDKQLRRAFNIEVKLRNL